MHRVRLFTVLFGYPSVLLSFHYLLCERTISCNQLIFNRGTKFNSSSYSHLVGIDGISLKECVEICSSKPKCISLEYRYLAKYCSLRKAVSPLTMYAGYLTVQGFNTTHGSGVCEDNGICQIYNDSCSVKGCGYPDVDGDVLGNRFDVGSKLIHSTRTMICGEDGIWRTIGPFSYSGLTCQEIKQSNNEVTSGNYVNDLGMTILCDYDTAGGNWLVFQNRFDGSVDFYRTWNEYKMGFGNISGEFWFGLQNLHTILTNSSAVFELRISLEDWEGNKAYADYDLFDLGEEADGYRLNIGNYSGTAGDAMRRSNNEHDGQMFSTKDRDNDNHGNNCAELYTGAWWYNRCHAANLNGVYHPGGNTTFYAENVIWETWKGYHYSLKKTAMMIREKNSN